MSENTIAVLNYLQKNHGKNVTSADVAEELGLAKRTVDGVFTGLTKKKLGIRIEGEVQGTDEVAYLSLTETGMACDTTEMSDTVKKIVNHFVANNTPVTLETLSEAIDTSKKSVCGSFNALVKKGFAMRELREEPIAVKVKYLTLTPEGVTYVPSDEEATEEVVED